MEWPEELVELFDDPILENVRPKAAPLTANDRRVKKLQEISEWVKNNGRLPLRSGTIKEKCLWKSLDTLRKEASEELKVYDTLNLLEDKV